jgi:hypothetical protein
VKSQEAAQAANVGHSAYSGLNIRNCQWMARMTIVWCLLGRGYCERF